MAFPLLNYWGRRAALQELLAFLRDGWIIGASRLSISAENASGSEHHFPTGGAVTEDDLLLLPGSDTDKWLLYPAVLETLLHGRGYESHAIGFVLNRIDVEELVAAVNATSFERVADELVPPVGEAMDLLREASLRRTVERSRPTFRLDTLSVGPVPVKRFSKPAPNQRLILEAFEEEGWPDSIYDPLPQVSGVVPARRLRDAVDALNDMHLVGGIITFGLCGGGSEVFWKLMDP